jgi:hypothetical protein
MYSSNSPANCQPLTPCWASSWVHSTGKPAVQANSTSEALAFGAGDLHLPMGWGSIPWEGLATGCAWPANLVADVEVSHRHAADFPAAIATSRAWVARLALITPG